MSDVMSDECRVNHFLARQKKLIRQNNKAKNRSVTRQVKEGTSPPKNKKIK